MNPTIDTFINAALRTVEEDPHLAIYILRDRPEVVAAGLADLAWIMSRETPHTNDVLYFIERLRKAVKDCPETAPNPP